MPATTSPPAGARIDVLAHLGHYIGTIGFFVPALILIGLVVGAVVRDRRRHANGTAAEGPADAATPPPAD